MRALLVLMALGAVSARWLCSHGAPSDALRGQLTACRALNYAYCVDAPEHENDIERAALAADESLTAHYVGVSRTETQQCAFAWLAIACSDTFRRAEAPDARACATLCTAVARECRAESAVQFAACASPGAPACVDYSADGALCARAREDERDEGEPLPDAPTREADDAAPNRRSERPFERAAKAAETLQVSMLLMTTLVVFNVGSMAEF